MKYFTDKELACPMTGKVKLAPGFGEKLDALREALGEPMHINSACRSAEYNKTVGGNPNSFHVYDKPHYPTGGCCAVDVRCYDGAHRRRLILAALQLGWAVGIAKTFLHLDRRLDYTDLPPIVYLY